MRRPSPLLLLLLASQVAPLSSALHQSRRLRDASQPALPLFSRKLVTDPSTSTSGHVSVAYRVLLHPFLRSLQDTTTPPCRAPSFQVQYGGLTFCTRCTDDQVRSTSDEGVTFCKAISCREKYGLSRPLWNPTLGTCQAAPGSPSCLPGFICAGAPPVHQPSGTNPSDDPTSDSATPEQSPDIPRVSSVASPPPTTGEPTVPVTTTNTVPPGVVGGPGSGTGHLSGTPGSPVVHPLGSTPVYSSGPSPPSVASLCGPHGSWSVTTGQCVCAHGWAPSSPGIGTSGSTNTASGSSLSTSECSTPQGAIANPPIDSEASTAPPGSAANTPGGQDVAGGGASGSGSGNGTSGVPVVWVVLVGLALLSLSCACGAGALCCWRRARRREAAQDKARKSLGDVRNEMWRLAQAHGSFAVIQEGAQGGVPPTGAPGVHPVLMGGHPADAHRWDAGSAGTPYWHQMRADPFQGPAAGSSTTETVQRARGFSEPPPMPAPAVPWALHPGDYSQGAHLSPGWTNGVTTSLSRGGSHPTFARPASSSDPPSYRAAVAASSVPGPDRHRSRNPLPVAVYPASGLRCLGETCADEGEENLC